MSDGQAILMASSQRSDAATEKPTCQAKPTGMNPKTKLESLQYQTSWCRTKSATKRIQTRGDFITKRFRNEAETPQE